MRATCPIPFTALGLAAVPKLVTAQIPKLRVSFSLVSSYPPTSRSIRSLWHIQFTLFRYVHEINFTHI